MRPARFLALLIGIVSVSALDAAPPGASAALVKAKVDAEYPSLFGIYTHLHAHPELSFMEVKTAALVAGELATGEEVEALGFRPGPKRKFLRDNALKLYKLA